MTDETTRATIGAHHHLPSVDEVLGGATQAGVTPPPSFVRQHRDDGTRQRAGGGDFLAAAAAVPSVAEAGALLKAARAEEQAAWERYFEAQERSQKAQEALEAAVAREHGL